MPCVWYVQVAAAEAARREVDSVRRDKDQELAAAVARAKMEAEAVRDARCTGLSINPQLVW
jgi:hypothetical protein